MDYELVYEAENYYSNLIMFKCLHDAGIPLEQFYETCSISPAYSSSSISNFFNIILGIFEMVECYGDYEQENIDNINHWVDEYKLDLDDGIFLSTVAYLILDDGIKPFEAVQGAGYNPMTDACCDIYYIESGMLILFDSDYGQPDFSELMADILQLR